MVLPEDKTISLPLQHTILGDYSLRYLLAFPRTNDCFEPAISLPISLLRRADDHGFLSDPAVQEIPDVLTIVLR